MFRIKTWIPVEIDPEEDMLYTKEDAEKEKTQLAEMQPENKYEIEEVIPKVTPWICPQCGKKTTDYPALSRRDNKTKICSDCGMEEALIDFSIVQKEK